MGQGPGEVDQLFLPGGKAIAALAQRFIEPLGQSTDKVAHVHLIGRSLHPLVRNPVRAQANVFGDGSGEKERILQHYPEIAPQLRDIMFADIHSIDQDISALNLVEAHHQPDDGGLAGAGVTYNRRCLVRLDGERYILENPLHFGCGGEKFNILQAAMAACERIFKLLDTPSEIVSPVAKRTGDASNRIEFRHVWFTYQKLTPEQEEKVAKAEPAELAGLADIEWILKDVSFTVEPGQTVAIVGHTGAGKTTLTGLMMRFYDVTRGAIYLDGVDLREQDLEALRRHFAVVLQDPFLFTGTIAENIRLGSDWITDERMKAAADEVNVGDFIRALPQGFDEPLRERGNSLSTGQKQLINFARALAHDPRVLVLDEATSSVDTDTEMRVRSALERMVRGRTSVIIAHRLSTVQQADRILVMHKGVLREFGTHQELLAQRGIYWKLYQLQYKDQEMQPVRTSSGLLDASLAIGTD